MDDSKSCLRGGKWQQYKQQLIRELTTKYRLKIQMTTKEISASMLTDEAKQDRVKNIIVCGGDGTITEVAGKIIHSDISLGIVPFGTANALCHVLYGLETKVSPVETACKAILSENVQRIDTAKCNDNLMLLVMGIGFEQKMIESANRENKNEHGQLAYLTGFFKAVVANNQTQHLNIKLDEQPYQKLDVQSLVIANTAPFSTLLAHGGDTPEPNDGKLHITYLEQTDSLPEKLFALSDLAISSIGIKETATQFKYFSGDKVTITSDSSIDYVVDGENYSSQFINIEMIPSSLNVRVP
ncbi:diacylglycerol kinase family protein [Psychromonas sp. KJ10-10]|uniref:diacylglycerol kinase family protein n=1 Tax=Psychromonas sp. KJ10-10 TaxID=3391823 RepID=UPI0039B3CABE